MKKSFMFGVTILALAAACCAHPGHAKQAYGLFWKQSGQSHPGAVAETRIWQYAFVSVYQWTGSR
jgi:hypothetical protein